MTHHPDKSDPTSELVERLRAEGKCYYCDAPILCREAADTITQLHQQAEAMAEALEPFLKLAGRAAEIAMHDSGNLISAHWLASEVKVLSQALALYRKGQPDE